MALRYFPVVDIKVIRIERLVQLRQSGTDEERLVIGRLTMEREREGGLIRGWGVSYW